MHYLTGHGPRSTPQSEPLRSDQVENSAGGYAWATSPEERLRRFLILGAEGGTYYVGQRALVRENITALEECLHQDGPGAVELIASISEDGRAPKNDPAIFALAVASVSRDEATRRAALEALPRVVRIGTHLFTFAKLREEFGGWGRAVRRAVGNWYLDLDPTSLAYQLIKYRQRGGWSHRDLLRLSHPLTSAPIYRTLFDFACGREIRDRGDLPPIAAGYLRAQEADTSKKTAELVRAYGLPREALQTEHLSDPEVWQAMLDADMPIGALVRNLGTMARVGLLKPMSEAANTVCDRLSDAERLRKARIHPIGLLSALAIYTRGYGARSDAEPWKAVPQVTDALNGAFYEAFQNVKPAGKRTLLALDVSGSMGMGEIAGVPGLTPRIGSAAMALVTAATESSYGTVAFTHKLVPVALSPSQRLDDVIRSIGGLSFGGTDCALPMLYANEEGLEIDTFVVYTDSETWAGRPHPAQALQDYREKSGIDAKLIVVGMTSNGFSIADPQDAGMLDVVGFDTAAPAVMADFARGDL